MQVALENNIVFVVIDYLAILCWGLSGGLAAIRKGYDIFTIMLCGWLTALGGGLVRDVMLGALPPVGITDKGYVPPYSSACSPLSPVALFEISSSVTYR